MGNIGGGWYGFEWFSIDPEFKMFSIGFGVAKQWMLETEAEVSNRVLWSNPKKPKQPIPRELTLLAKHMETKAEK